MTTGHENEGFCVCGKRKEHRFGHLRFHFIEECDYPPIGKPVSCYFGSIKKEGRYYRFNGRVGTARLLKIKKRLFCKSKLEWEFPKHDYYFSINPIVAWVENTKEDDRK